MVYRNDLTLNPEKVSLDEKVTPVKEKIMRAAVSKSAVVEFECNRHLWG
jgi:hypothetical protein